MVLFEAVLVLLTACVLLFALARRLQVPYPAFLALAGAALALAPVVSPIRLNPSLALALFVAPVLLDAAYDTSLRDLRRNWAYVGSLVLVAVGLTTTAVAVTARLLVPAMPWAAAIALGALVAPPDAAAATAILRQVNLPHRVVVVLEGESLLNDASALLVYRLAVAAALADGGFHPALVAPAFLLSVAGSLVAGPLLALAYGEATRRLSDAPSSIILQFVGCFGVWILAERLGMSPILTMVAYALTLARWAPARVPARMRIPSYAVWETAVLMLNALAFVLIGLQLRPILAAAPRGELRTWMVFAGAVLAVAIGVRIAWVAVHTVVLTAWRRAHGVDQAPGKGWKNGVVIAWSGMRGIVTLAAALALPEGFPFRDLLLFTAFAVTFGTLVLQGLSLRPLLLRLDLHDDRPVEREVRLARVELARAALALLDGEDGPGVETLRRKFSAQRDTAAEAQDGEGRAVLPEHRLLRRALGLQRERLLQLRRQRRIGDDAFHRLEAELDYAELATVADPA